MPALVLLLLKRMLQLEKRYEIQPLSSIHHSLCQTLPLLLDVDVLLPKPRNLLVPLYVVNCQVAHLLLQLLDLSQGDVDVFTYSMFLRNESTDYNVIKQTHTETVSWSWRSPRAWPRCC